MPERIQAPCPGFSDTVFEFLDEDYPLSGDSSDSSAEEREWGDDEEVEEEDSATPEEKNAFWDEQQKLLHEALYRTSSAESRVREATKESLKKLGKVRVCTCGRARGDDGCRDCLRREIFNHLCVEGFHCSIRNSKWKTSTQIPSGEHTYLEVIEKAKAEKGEVKIVIELNLKAEFEIGKASQEYKDLIQRLPEVYVAKPERLRNVIKILCGAAKKCMEDKKMHLGPWRKHKYMLAKWFGPSTTTTTTNSMLRSLVVRADQYSGTTSTARPRASMLTLSLLDQLPQTNCQVVAVV